MLEQAVRAASAPLRVPGQPDTPEQPRVWQVIGAAQAEAIAREHALPGWQVEVAALDAGIVPVPYMRNMARFALHGQRDLLRSAVTVVGSGLPAEKCLQTVAAHGIGRVRILVPAEPPTPDRPSSARPAARAVRAADPDALASDDPRLTSPETLAAVVTNQNHALETSCARLELRRGDPTSLLGAPGFAADAWVVVACLEDAADEMLLQVACRRLGVPLVLAGIQEDLGQATTILPGDPGVPLIYQADHPHLERHRPGSLRAAGYQGRIAGTWLADQVIVLRLGQGELLQNRLLYADMQSGEMRTFPLGR